MALRNNRVLPRLMNAVGMCKDETIIYQYASIELYRLRERLLVYRCRCTSFLVLQTIVPPWVRSNSQL